MNSFIPHNRLIDRKYLNLEPKKASMTPQSKKMLEFFNPKFLG